MSTRAIGNVLGQDALERIRKKWPYDPIQRAKRLQAAFSSGLLRVGRLYCRQCARSLEQQFELLDYDPVVFRPVMVEVNWLLSHLVKHDLHLETEIERLQAVARREGAVLRYIVAWELSRNAGHRASDEKSNHHPTH